MACVSPSLAATGTDIINVTVGGSATSPEGSGFSIGQGYGSVSPATTVDGYPYQTVQTVAAICTPKACTSGSTDFSVGGLTANPGQAWLTSVAFPSGTLSGASARFVYSSGVATWNWQGTQVALTVGSQATVSVVHALAAGTAAYLKPKYQVIGVYYAPPGSKASKNSTTYGSSFVSGTNVSSGSSFTKTGTVSLIGKVTGVPDVIEFTDTSSTSYSEEQGTSDSVALTNTEAQNYTIYGPSADGIDHTQDIIWIWLNPVVKITTYPLAVATTGLAMDGRDLVSETGQPDVIELTVAQLQQLAAGNTSIIETEDLGALNRTWDTSWDQGPAALTVADYKDILKSDLFVANPTLNPATNASRFDPVDTSFPYAPTTNPSLKQVTSTYQKTSTQGQSATDTHTTTVTVETTGGFPLIGNANLKVTGSYESTNNWSNSTTTTDTQTSTINVTPPNVTDMYEGPTTILVFKDNVYGTFVFYGAPP
jgi:hypothetical protein